MAEFRYETNGEKAADKKPDKSSLNKKIESLKAGIEAELAEEKIEKALTHKKSSKVKKIILYAGAGILGISSFLGFYLREKEPFAGFRVETTYEQAYHNKWSAVKENPRKIFIEELSAKIRGEYPQLEELVYDPLAFFYYRNYLRNKDVEWSDIESVSKGLSKDKACFTTGWLTKDFGKAIPVPIFVSEIAFEKEDSVYFNLRLWHELTHVLDFYRGIKVGDFTLDNTNISKVRPRIIGAVMELRGYYDQIELVREEKIELEQNWYKSHVLDKYDFFINSLKEYAAKPQDLTETERTLINIHLNLKKHL